MPRRGDRANDEAPQELSATRTVGVQTAKARHQLVRIANTSLPPVRAIVMTQFSVLFGSSATDSVVGCTTVSVLPRERLSFVGGVAVSEWIF